MASIACLRCHQREHHLPDCPEMFFGGDRTKPRGVPGAMPPRTLAADIETAPSVRKQHAAPTFVDELDRIRPGHDYAEEQRRLADRNRRASLLRDLWWSIVKDAKEFERARLGRAVRWARAGLGFEEAR